MKVWDAIFIGGGASGLVSAIMLKRQCPTASILIVEKQNRVGKKLLATGNGTCNLSNIHVSPKHYHGENKEFSDFILTMFPPDHAKLFFESLGVICEQRENGRIYPVCASAAAVLDCIRNELNERDVTIKTDCFVKHISQKNSVYTLECENEKLFAKNIVVCTGGSASPSLGGSDSGYHLLRKMGHHVTSLYPSIVQVKSNYSYLKAIKGLRVNAKVYVQNNKTIIDQTEGEVLFTEYGLSGPAIMQLSRYVNKSGNSSMILDLLPTFSNNEVFNILKKRQKSFPSRTLEDFMTGLLNKRIGQTILKTCDAIPFSRICSSLKDEEIKKIVSVLKGWEFCITGTQGLDSAQVTAGGVYTTEFNKMTLESKLCPNLYAMGEVLDVDGDCGGYNLHWAWASACAVASSIGKVLM